MTIDGAGGDLAYTRLDAPSWASFQTLDPTAPTETGAPPWLLTETHVRIEADGTAEVVRRCVVRVVDDTLRDQASAWELSLRPSFERLALHTARVWRDGAWSDRLATGRVTTAKREADFENAMLDDLVSALVVLDDVKRGDLVEVVWSVRGRDPALGEEFAGSFRLDEGPDVARTVLEVQYHPTVPLMVRANGELPAPERPDPQRLVWDLQPPPAFVAVPGDVPGDAAYATVPRVELSTFADWGEVARWAARQYQDSQVPLELRTLAVDLMARHADPEQRFEAALGWVQDELRYFAVHLDEHTLKPHALVEILGRRYGDCKDKAAVLVALLAEMGIEASPVLVDATWPGSALAALPSPAPFDHVVVAARVGGRDQWVDPTLAPTSNPAVGNRWLPAYRVGLPAHPAATTLSQPDPEASALGTQRVEYTYNLEPDLAYSVAVETVRTGRLAQEAREDFEGEEGPDPEAYLEWYTAPDLELESKGVEVVDRGADGVVVKEHYRGRQPGRFDTLRLEIGEVLPYVDSERRWPILLPAPRIHRETVVVRTPERWQLEGVDVSIDQKWFRFEAKSRVLPREIRIDYELETRVDRVEVRELADYSAAVDALADAIGYSIWNHEPPPPEPAHSAWLLLAVGLSTLPLLLEPTRRRLARQARP